jgi:hypothetical protein
VCRHSSTAEAEQQQQTGIGVWARKPSVLQQTAERSLWGSQHAAAGVRLRTDLTLFAVQQLHGHA